MIELVEKFYREDLTEAEEESLDSLLEASPEAADRFADLAGGAYARFGLPDVAAEGKGGSGRKIWWFLLLLVAGGVLWALHRREVPSADMKTQYPTPAIRLEAKKAKPLVKGNGAEREGEAVPVPTKVPRKRYKVTVNIGQAGPVTVKILSGEGKVVRELFTGTVPAGPTAFNWDGAFPDGSLAPPGDYRLEVQGGGRLESRYFRVK